MYCDTSTLPAQIKQIYQLLSIHVKHCVLVCVACSQGLAACHALRRSLRHRWKAVPPATRVVSSCQLSPFNSVRSYYRAIVSCKTASIARNFVFQGALIPACKTQYFARLRRGRLDSGSMKPVGRCYYYYKA